MRNQIKGKPSAHFVKPYAVAQKINLIADRLPLPIELWYAHNVLHVSQLQKFVNDPTHAIAFEPLELEANGLTYEEQLVRIVDHKVKQSCNKAIPLVKVI